MFIINSLFNCLLYSLIKYLNYKTKNASKKCNRFHIIKILFLLIYLTVYLTVYYTF